MKVYELLSDGTLILLPEEEGPAGVKVMLPWGRQLAGKPVLGFERWLLLDHEGRPEGEERILCDRTPLDLPGPGSVRLSAENCRQLRDALLGQIPPPGNHRSTVLEMEALWPAHRLFTQDHLWRSEADFIPMLHFSDGSLQLYWGLRMALFCHDQAMSDRLALWSAKAADILHGRASRVRMWVSPSPVVPEHAKKVLLERAFDSSALVKLLGEAKVMAMRNEEIAMIRCEGREAFGRAFVCAWFCVSRSLWERLLQKMRPEEAVICLWGHMDGLNAATEMRRYRSPVPQNRGA